MKNLFGDNFPFGIRRGRRLPKPRIDDMGIFSDILPPPSGYIALLVAIPTLYGELRNAQWKRLSQPGAFSAWCFAVIALPLLWGFNVPVAQGLTLHLFGVPIFIWMFGRRLAMAGVALSVVAYTGMHAGLWGNLGINLLLLALVPAYCGDAVMRATGRFLPKNIFIYLLGNGFFGTLAVLAVSGLMAMGTHVALIAGLPLQADAVAYMLLLAWGEAFLTGLLLTIFTVYRPEWVLTFDDEVYLESR